MDYLFRCSSKCSLEEFIRKLAWRENQSLNNDTHCLMIKFFALFCKSGLDYYELLALYSSLSHYSENDLKEILSYAPNSMSALSLSRNNIRKVIPRWTASRYHSATIESVIGNIHEKILSGTLGIFCYNSNLNPKSQRSLNDLYVLIIVGNLTSLLHINRKCTYRFLQGGM